MHVGTNDGRLVGIDANSGEQIWSFDKPDEGVTSPAVTGGVAYAGSADGRLYAVK